MELWYTKRWPHTMMVVCMAIFCFLLYQLTTISLWWMHQPESSMIPFTMVYQLISWYNIYQIVWLCYRSVYSQKLTLVTNQLCICGSLSYVVWYQFVIVFCARAYFQHAIVFHLNNLSSWSVYWMNYLITNSRSGTDITQALTTLCDIMSGILCSLLYQPTTNWLQ